MYDEYIVHAYIPSRCEHSGGSVHHSGLSLLSQRGGVHKDHETVQGNHGYLFIDPSSLPVLFSMYSTLLGCTIDDLYHICFAVHRTNTLTIRLTAVTVHVTCN